MKSQLAEIIKETKENIDSCNEISNLEEIRISILGKKGKITHILKGIAKLSNEEKKEIGMIANNTKKEITELINNKKNDLLTEEQNHKLKEESIDITLPGKNVRKGNLHPTTAMIDYLINILVRMGFTPVDGYELETEYYNFEALNIPADHPAREDQDSFYVSEHHLLRTHTSPTQVRIMKKYKPPLAIIHCGRCFRRDALDATHSHTFYQIEGLYVDKNVTFADLKGTLYLLAQELFGPDTEVRFRPDFFPFTEPSGEFAVTCFNCKGKGCNVCKSTGWIELGGCGLVDPEVFKNCDIDPEEYTGYAFGFGIERLIMTKYRVPDIRMFYENDLRFLKQFS